MNKKEAFITIVENEIFQRPDIYIENYPDIFDDAKIYFEALKTEQKEKEPFTENGKMILQYIQENKESFNNLFKAKDIGEGLGVSSRTVSGSIRKLVTDGYVERVGTNPAIYAITTKGEKVNF